MTELIITEKPKVAERIARSLGSAKKMTYGGVAYFQVGETLVAPAVGHIFGLREKKSGRWTYPVFDIEWAPNHEISKEADYTKKYLDNLRFLSKGADRFINACDYDVEGEVIGYNALKHACEIDPYGSDVGRMKFSTLTTNAIEQAYKKQEKIDKGMVEAGLTRHTLDWYWGINLSRALTLAVRKAKGYTTLSIGRVQGPTLKFLSVREKQIREFNSEIYWQVELQAFKGEKTISALYEDQKIKEKEKAEQVKASCEETARVKKVQRKQFKQAPPHPFDLTTLQTEAYKYLKIDPRRTLEIAQELYTSALISYPRTSSQQLPPDINYNKIIDRLIENEFYRDLCHMLQEKGKLKPNNGKKTDPAHPAIHPTGLRAINLGKDEGRIYDLIVRRFLATFGDWAVRETVKVELLCGGNRFLAEGTITLEKGWHVLYGQFAKFKEVELPVLNEGEILNVKDVLVHEKETQPPNRYSPASIIREMERYNIGTKATRSQIVDILFRRGYVVGKSMEVTPLGLKVYDTLREHCPLIMDMKLTRKFEQEMEEIEKGDLKSDQILEKGRKTLTGILEEFRGKEAEIGRSLAKSIHETKNNAENLGKCQKCENGNLVLRKSPYGGFFIGCSDYPNCDYTITIPKGKVKKTGECRKCGYAILTLQGKKRFSFCINPQCPSKKK
ncbi:DNA topoisomerase I [Candidatus Altiarchaeota archaeon]